MKTVSEGSARLREMFDQSKRAVFFGGAGVSTESGIPDFRSSNGLYRLDSGVGYRPEEVVSHSFFTQHPRDFWKFYLDKMVYRDALPNTCHKTLARLEEQGKLACVVTQNIDGLHQAAGSKRVHELHGSIHRNTCLSCKATFDLDGVLSAAAANPGEAVRCPHCGGLIKPDVVLYEEPLDDAVVEAAVAAIARADLLVVAGTSLAVWPAAGFLNYFSGDTIAVVNLTPTSVDESADLVIREPVAQVFDW